MGVAAPGTTGESFKRCDKRHFTLAEYRILATVYQNFKFLWQFATDPFRLPCAMFAVMEIVIGRVVSKILSNGRCVDRDIVAHRSRFTVSRTHRPQ
jgi:hypothetical protein